MTDFYGVRPEHAAAGVGGGLAYLPFLKGINALLALGAVVAGVATAAFLTPLAIDLLANPHLGIIVSPRAELGIAFLLGFTAMIVLPTILAFASWVRDNVAKIGERVFGTRGNDGNP